MSKSVHRVNNHELFLALNHNIVIDYFGHNVTLNIRN